ncbi:MAG: molecular chaperone TorD family protein [Deltaproteobacteria bacterium]
MSAQATNERAILSDFAELFSYPRGDVARIARHCLELLGPGHPAASALEDFAAWAALVDPGEIEEVYSGTFDLEPTCAPYVGWQLCPDPERRNLFLSELSAVYSREGFRPREELGDHVAEMLRFLAVARDEEARLTVLREGLGPAVERMVSSFEPPFNPYRWLLDALAAHLAPGAVQSAIPAADRARPAQEARP